MTGRLLRVALVVAAVCCCPAAAHAATLVALGDSYSSGEGAPPYDKASAGCHRSADAWPLDAARQLGMPGRSLACSGAVTDEVTITSSDRKPERAVSQVAQLATIPDVQVVTITVGGNDVGFAKVLAYCWKHAHCDRHYQPHGKDTLTPLIQALEPKLVTTYQTVREAAPSARIVVLGYPRLFPAAHNTHLCATDAGLSGGEASYLNAKATELGAVVHDAARDAQVFYVDTAGAFSGHEVDCSPAEWVNELQPRVGVPPYRSTSFHPTLLGQRRLADLAVASITGGPLLRLSPEGIGVLKLGDSFATATARLGPMMCGSGIPDDPCACAEPQADQDNYELAFNHSGFQGLFSLRRPHMQTSTGLRIGDPESLIENAYRDPGRLKVPNGRGQLVDGPYRIIGKHASVLISTDHKRVAGFTLDSYHPVTPYDEFCA